MSQCLYAGAGVMNFTKDIGWYYRSAEDRAAAWTGVEYLHTFLIRNNKAGPVGVPVDVAYMMPGDIVQLSFDGRRFSHSLMVVETGIVPGVDNILICAHTDDSLNRPVSDYDYAAIRFIHITEVRVC